MSGIVHEPRLTRLLALRDRLDEEIATERDLEERRERNRSELRAAEDARVRQERRDSVSHTVVRQWARTYGHPCPARGRVPADLIDQYLDAHPAATQQGRRA